MRKKGLFLFVLMIMGVISYFGGYYLYLSSNPKTEIADPVHFQRTGILAEDLQEGRQEYYLAKIDQESLVIYKMPEKIFYDSVKVNSLHLQEKEKMQLSVGQRFESLAEVYEFLENIMS